MKKIARKIGYLAACFALIALLSCDPKPPPPQVKKAEVKLSTELTRAIYSDHIQLDPHFIKSAAEAAPIRDLLVGLMQFNPKGKTIPAIGREFFSEDGKNWLILLDENAKWSNDQAVTAQDFVASWQRLANPENSSPLAPYLVYMGVENAKEVIAGEKSPLELGVTALSDYSLKIILNTPNFQLPKMLAHMALLPTYQGRKPQPNTPFMSNGSYQISEQSKSALSLKARSPDIAFQQVYYRLLGTIQNPDRFDIIENPLEHYHHNETRLPRNCTYFYEFNFNDPYLKHQPIRQAIREMISPSEISRDLGIPTHYPLPRSMVRKLSQRLTHRVPEQIFHELGIDSQKPLRLTLTYDNEGLHDLIANRIARTLGQSDLFRVQRQGVDWDLLLAKRENKDFQLIRGGWCADYSDPLVFLMPFHSASPDNKSGYANSQVDQQLEQLQQHALGEEERDTLILNIVQQLQNDVAILPLFQYQRRVAIDPDIRGVELHNSSEGHL